jgi:hypothetical protein
MKRPGTARRLLVCLTWIAGLAGLSYAHRRAADESLASPLFVLPSSVDTLILGDSHAACGLDPALIPRSATFARGGEPLFLTCQKLQFLAERNQGLKKVVIGFGSHNVSRYQESYLFEDFWEADFEQYFGIVDAEGRHALASLRTSYLVSRLKWEVGLPVRFYRDRPVLDSWLHRPIAPEDFGWVGRFDAPAESHVDEAQISGKIRRYYLDAQGGYAGTSQLTLNAVRGALAFARSRGIQVLLYDGPLHPAFRARVPPRAYDAYREALADIAGTYPEVRVAALGDYPLPSDAFFDGDHVNASGAAVASRVVANLLERLTTGRP